MTLACPLVAGCIDNKHLHSAQLKWENYKISFLLKPFLFSFTNFVNISQVKNTRGLVQQLSTIPPEQSLGAHDEQQQGLILWALW